MKSSRNPAKATYAIGVTHKGSIYLTPVIIDSCPSRPDQIHSGDAPRHQLPRSSDRRGGRRFNRHGRRKAEAEIENAHRGARRIHEASQRREPLRSSDLRGAFLGAKRRALGGTLCVFNASRIDEGGVSSLASVQSREGGVSGDEFGDSAALAGDGGAVHAGDARAGQPGDYGHGGGPGVEGAVVAGLSGESGREGVDREEKTASWEVRKECVDVGLIVCWRMKRRGGRASMDWKQSLDGWLCFHSLSFDSTRFDLILVEDVNNHLCCLPSLQLHRLPLFFLPSFLPFKTNTLYLRLFLTYSWASYRSR